MGTRARVIGLAAAAAVLVLAYPAGATAAGTSVLAGRTMDAKPIPCSVRPSGVRVCHGSPSGAGGADLRLKSFDGTPLALYVTLPPAPAADGAYPLVVQSHGWAAPTTGPTDRQYGGPTANQWAKDGYAVLQLVARGWGDSCGSPASRAVHAGACEGGYIHLDDLRYEARDVQTAVGLLVDEGLADPDRIGVMGESYGAGVSLELATLKNRVMRPDGSLHRWRSPDGTPLRIAAAAPFAGWSDLVYALAPNGSTFDSGITSSRAALSPVGVEKSSIVNGLYASGLATSAYYAPPGVNPEANLVVWQQNLEAGEPYDTPVDRQMVRQIAKYHSPYYLLKGAYGFEKRKPAPLHFANGFTDDIFPADEVLRYYNLARSLYPSTPMSLLFDDVGHQRSQSKPADSALLPPRIHAFFDHYVKGTRSRPRMGVTALTQTCPSDAPSGGPYHARSWAALHPDAVKYSSKPGQKILSSAGDPTIAAKFDPVLGGLACTTAPAADEGPGVARYELPAATGSGYTLLGSPTVTAHLKVTGEYPYIAARLLDVDPETKTETLVARGIYRIDMDAPNGVQKFQLHPNGWRFEAGHVPTLQLLGQDAPYARISNGTFSIAVRNLKLRLPVASDTTPCGKPLAGTSGPDKLTGTTGGDLINAGRGDDRVRARGGDDCVHAGRGSDTVSLGPGRDKVNAGPGADVVRSRDGRRDIVDCGPGRDLAFVDRRDRVRGCERERVA